MVPSDVKPTVAVLGTADQATPAGTLTAGEPWTMVHGSRDVGVRSSSVIEIVVVDPDFSTSNNGASAVTVIDSDIEGFSVPVTSAVLPAATVRTRVAAP